MNSSFVVSVFTNQNKNPLSKCLKLDSEGNIVKETAAQLTEGSVETVSFENINSFCEFMINLDPHKAVSFGLSNHSKIRVLSQSKAQNCNSDKKFITRTREHFSWSDNAGILFLDYDPAPGTKILKPSELIDALRQAVPELKNVTMALKPSVSSCIYNQGQEIHGIKGQHIFVLCNRASKIPDIGKLIFDRLWLHGHGYIHVSKSGHMLERTIIDASVWQPERLIFGRAQCSAGLEQRFPAAFMFPPKN